MKWPQMLRNVMLVCFAIVYLHIWLTKTCSPKVVYVLPHKHPAITKNACGQDVSSHLAGLNEMFEFARSGVEWERDASVIPPPRDANVFPSAEKPVEEVPVMQPCALPVAFDGWAGASACPI